VEGRRRKVEGGRMKAEGGRWIATLAGSHHTSFVAEGFAMTRHHY